MSNRIRVYIAGPLSQGDREQNVRNAIEAGRRLIEAGFSVFVPHLSHYMDETDELGHDTWVAVDLQWVAVSDAVLRLPGRSSGADAEVRHAQHLGIPVYHDIEELITNPPSKGDARFHALLRRIAALHDELAAARARIAALENQLDELGEGAYRAAAERDNRYVPQLHELKGRAERAEAMCVVLRDALNAMGVTFSADETRLAAVVIGGKPIDHYPDMEARIERIAAAHARRLELIAADDPGAQIRRVVDAARRFVQAIDATEASIRPDPDGVIDGPHGQALRAAVAALDATREEVHGDA